MIQRNGTNLGEFTIESGSIGLDQLGLIRDWNGNTKLSYWNDDLCDMINGTLTVRFCLTLILN